MPYLKRGLAQPPGMGAWGTASTRNADGSIRNPIDWFGAAWDDLKTSVADVISGGPVPATKPAPAPAAPQTQEQMRTWTPKDLAAADKQNFLAWAKDPYPESVPSLNMPSLPDPKSVQTYAWVIAGTAIAVLWLVSRRR